MDQPPSYETSLSDLAFTRGGREWPLFPASPGPCFPSPGPHLEHTNPGYDRRPAVMTRAGIG